MTAPALRVALVDPTVTLPLRQQVLRPHQSVEDIADETPEAPDVLAVAAFVTDQRGAEELVGTAIVLPEPLPDLPGRPGGWRLRGMATATDYRDRGVGAQVLGRVIETVRDRGGLVLWCNARVRAQPFYERAGLTVIGEPWVDPQIGPHVRMWREL